MKKRQKRRNICTRSLACRAAFINFKLAHSGAVLETAARSITGRPFYDGITPTTPAARKYSAPL
jgi:hypothetical protein